VKVTFYDTYSLSYDLHCCGARSQQLMESKQLWSVNRKGQPLMRLGGWGGKIPNSKGA
uniref:Uncharacterized protein n=1 Tax=Piliocolobus tephrosceles TaxID=591936 RepID=A0A8C9IKE0_9PRIM